MKTDWVAAMFCALRDCGEDISIVFGEQDPGSSQAEPRWTELPHDQYDGISGFAELLRLRGLCPGPLPCLRGDRLDFFRGVRGVLAVLPALGVRRQQWASPFHWTREVRFLPPTGRVAHHLFTQAQTARIVTAAEAAGATVNTFLLHRLDAVVSAHLTAPGASRRWMIPVNLRGAVTRQAVLPPHMSFLGVDIGPAPAPRELQAAVDRLRRRGYHWGMWILLHLGRVLGAEGLRRDIRKREGQGHGVTGMFSNLGAWTVPGAGAWTFCPAVTRVYPVGAGCVTVNGRMALALQLHEALGRNLHTSRALLEAWRGACLGEPAHAEQEAEEPGLPLVAG